MTDKLQIHSIFRSLQGESTYAGRPCVFIRLAGCSLNCRFCDTPTALTEFGTPMSRDKLVSQVVSYRTSLVEVTGGEPLEQPNSLGLLCTLCDLGFTVLLETNGVMPVSSVDKRVTIVMDIKTPSAGVGEVLSENIPEIKRRHGQVKFVVGTRRDFEYAVDITRHHDLERYCEVLISPLSTLDRATAAKWILDSHMAFRLQLQLHKIVWPDAQKEV